MNEDQRPNAAWPDRMDASGGVAIEHEPVGVMDPDVQAESRSRAATAGWGTSGSEADRHRSDGAPEPIESVAAVNGHPIHPMLVPVPIGMLVGSLLSDLAYTATHDRFWARASMALTGGALVSGGMAAVAGLTDFLGRSRIREHRAAWYHAGGNAAVMGLAATGLAMRARDPEGAVMPMGLALTLTSAALLLVTGWLGGEMVYRDRIGVIPTGAERSASGGLSSGGVR